MRRIEVVAVLCGLLFSGRFVVHLRAEGPLPVVKQLPPPGVEIADEDQQKLKEATGRLGQVIELLRRRTDATTQRHFPDVEIFHRAVDQALRHNEFFDKEADVKRATALLVEGESRANELLRGNTPWAEKTGLVVRGYRSRLDGTVQPYGVVVPPSFADDSQKKRRCDLWLHGRGETDTELRFIEQRLKIAGEFQPENTFVVHPFGRYCNAFKTSAPFAI